MELFFLQQPNPSRKKSLFNGVSRLTLTLKKNHCTGILQSFLPYMWDANSSLQNLV